MRKGKTGILPDIFGPSEEPKTPYERLAPGQGPSDCRSCQRLAAHLDGVRERFPDYHARPVCAFGDPSARLLIVGLAPGLHGANRTGRPFTGDHAGILLYRMLHRYGFASGPVARSADDGLTLRDCLITNAVKCVPPMNVPRPDEIRNCNHYLADEIRVLKAVCAILALGLVAHRAVVAALRLRQSAFGFSHGARHALPSGVALFDSYHCSRYNTQTKRLTGEAFSAVFAAIRAELDSGNSIAAHV